MTNVIADIEAGFELPALSWSMSLGHMRLFSGWPGWVKYGREPVNQHTSEEAAQKLGRPAPIVQGLQMSSCLEEMLIDFFGMEWFHSGKLSVYYVGITIPGDTVTSKARVISKLEQGERTRLEMEIWGENQRGAKVVVGFASVLQ
jgi:acyl dehydratase